MLGQASGTIIIVSWVANPYSIVIRNMALLNTLITTLVWNTLAIVTTATSFLVTNQLES